jgi:predicted permease
VLLVGAGLLLKSYRSLRSVNLGCATDNVLTMHIALPKARYKTAGEVTAFFEGVIRDVRQLPGVERAGWISHPPGTGYGGDNQFTVPEHPALRPGEFRFGIRRYADPGYFEAMGIPLLSGRTFREGERLDAARQVIIEDSFARRYFPGENPVGEHVRVALANNIDFEVFEIVGVVGDTRQELSRPTDAMIYYPTYSGRLSDSYLVVRSRLEVTRLTLPIQKLIAARDADLAVDIQTMQQIIGWWTTDASFTAGLTLGFAVLSLVVASVGLYGVLSYLVAQRTSEIGVRMALGALPAGVLRLTLLDGMRPAVAGLALGLAGGAAAARAIQGLLYGVKPLDVSVYAGVAMILMAVACSACLLPAWRASRLDPVRALRME